MPTKKLKPKTKSSKTKQLSKNVKNFKGTSLKLGDLFSFSTKNPAKKNFSSSFKNENFMVDLKSNVKNGEAKINLKFEGNSYHFNGVFTMSEKSFNEFYALVEHLLSRVTKR